MKLERIAQEGYEEVVKCEDPESGLRAMIAVHDTTLGPALGGLRMWPYGVLGRRHLRRAASLAGA